MSRFYNLYGQTVQCDLEIPFLKSQDSKKNPDIIVRQNKKLRFLENIESNETISHLNVNKGRVENIFYKCKISNGFLIEYNLKKNHNNLSLLLNFLHMPFAFVMFQKGYLPLHGMSFLHKDKSIVLSGTSGSGKSTLSSIFSNIYKIRSEDITCIYNRDNKILMMLSMKL